MKKEFINYIKSEFCLSDEDLKSFSEHISKPLKKSIRINTNLIKVEDFKKLAKKNNWELKNSNMWNNLFYIDREDTSIALWNTKEHMDGLFYIQEVAASSSPYYMSWDKIDKKSYTILDMSSSPWWKTTQLCEYFPNSLIVSNEFDKSRLKKLFSNIDRMYSINSIVTNYDGRFFKNHSEIFDKVLLDAPCSWEWTWFKNDDALKFWNIKNIKRIAKLQFWLLESAIKVAKIWWEIFYSTCTLNKIENEWVVEKIYEKYKDSIELLPYKWNFENDEKKDIFKRNWPHINKTGWFFVARIKKIKSIDWEDKNLKVRQNIEKLKAKEIKTIKQEFLDKIWIDSKKYFFYKYKKDIYLTNINLDFILDKFFLYKIWIKIWEINNWVIKLYEEKLETIGNF